MFSLIFLGAIFTMVIGLAAKFYLDKVQSRNRIDNKELTVISIVMLILVIPLTAYVGIQVSLTNQVTFHENWGGFEVRAEWIRQKTQRDGNMKHYYQGDPYQVWVDTSYTDSDGNYHSEGHYETRYHDIPYTTEETSS